MNEYDVKFHFTRDHLVIDKNSPMSVKDRFGIGVWLGKRYTDNLRLEVIKGMNERESRGYWNHKAPFGYLNIRVSGRAKVIVDEEVSPYIKEVFEMYVTGNYSWSELTDYINKKIVPKKVGKTMVERMVANPFYYGGMVVKGKLLSGKHEKIVTKNLWDDCQRIKGIRSMNQGLTEKAKVKKPLMGLLHCGICHSKVTGEVKRKKSGKQYTYYHCANTKCAQRRINTREEKILVQLTASFKPFSNFTTEGTKKLLKGLKTKALELDLHCQKRLTELSETRLRISSKMKQLNDLKKDGVLDENEYQVLVSKNKPALESCEKEIENFLESKDTVFNSGLKVIELLQKTYNYMDLGNDLLAKAKMAKIVLSNPILVDGSIGFSYENPFDNLLKNLTQKKWWAI
ncbi:MAG: hypothetical protein ACJAS4_003861 [Bacteriovoracaceae bacterium]|jgi:site-specific DNA recombinase